MDDSDLKVTEVHGGVAGQVGAGHDASSDLALRVAVLSQLPVVRGDLAEVFQFPQLAASTGAVGLHTGEERVLKYFLTGRDWTREDCVSVYLSSSRPSGV